MSETKKMVYTKAYKAIMSKGDPIKIDQDELDKVIDGCAQGNLIMVKQGLINPSYLINVVIDAQRIAEWHRECQHGYGQGEKARSRGIKQISSIFGGTNAGIALEKRDRRLLGGGSN